MSASSYWKNKQAAAQAVVAEDFPDLGSSATHRNRRNGDFTSLYEPDRDSGRRQNRGRSHHAQGQRPREQGVVTSLKGNFGFMKCVERDEDMFFHFDEV